MSRMSGAGSRPLPRRAEEIRHALPAELTLTAWTAFRVGFFHDFVLCAARRPLAPTGAKRLE
jgi:hypothetical protein